MSSGAAAAFADKISMKADAARNLIAFAKGLRIGFLPLWCIIKL